MNSCAQCMLCLLNREVAAMPQGAPAPEKAAHLRDVMAMLAQSDPSLCTAQLSARMDALYTRRFGEKQHADFAALKRAYNARMLALAPRLDALIRADADPLACALKLARAGNYIDFGAQHTVVDAQLEALLASAAGEPLDTGEYAHLCEEMAGARRVVYVTDNAGEIVLDRLLILQLMARWPGAAFTLLVRGAPTLNDATLADARETGLCELVPVVGNGSALPGTVWAEISEQARELLAAADVVIAKGQANFETLSGCGLNVYYLLLCKCDYFVRRFGVPRLTGLFVNEHRLPPLPA